MSAVSQMLAIFGPVILTAMGVVVSLIFPIRGRRGNWPWLIAFLIVGTVVSTSVYYQTRTLPETAAAPVTVAPSESSAQSSYSRPVRRMRVMRLGERHERGNRGGREKLVVEVPVQTRQTVTTFAIPKPSTFVPPNTLQCAGFTHNPDGSWEAGSDTQPFDVGTASNITIRNQGPIVAGWVTVGGADLYAVINAKCGGKH